MATSAPLASTAQVCNYCHQKPRFSNHPYCSKTCATQAATLCNHCHKKPKFQNFDYCGKNCAALGNPGGKGRSGGSNGVSQAPVLKPSNGKGISASNNILQPQAQPQVQPALDPIQLAKIVAQHIPQVQALLGPGFASSSGASGSPNAFGNSQGSTYAVPPIPVANAQTAPIQPNPFLGGIPATTQNLNGGISSSNSSNPHPATQQKLHISTQQHNQQVANHLECLIPGCGKPVHVDKKGMKTSDYCSMRHREEAVTSGLVSPCILCLVMPQSETDYFCSYTCREESMNKPPDRYEDDWEIESAVSP